MAVDFVVAGIVDGRPSAARWEHGVLDAEPELLRRAQIVVALGEEFRTDDGRVVAASLEGGVATALTLMRAFSRVTRVVVHPC
jgi:hypothetical protein